MKKSVISILLILIIVVLLMPNISAFAETVTADDIIDACKIKKANDANELLKDICEYYRYDTQVNIILEMKELSEEKIDYMNKQNIKGVINDEVLKSAITEYSNIEALFNKNSLSKTQYLIDIELKTGYKINKTILKSTDFYLICKRDDLDLAKIQEATVNMQGEITEDEKAKINAEIEKDLLSLDKIYSDIKAALVEYQMAIHQNVTSYNEFKLGNIGKDSYNSVRISSKTKHMILFGKIIDYNLALIDLNVKSGGYIADQAKHFEAYIGSNADWTE